MKEIFKVIIFLNLTLIPYSRSIAGGDSVYIFPEYQLRVTNYTYTSSSFEFDIYIKHTNPQVTVFELAGHQYYFEMNPALTNGGSFTYNYVTNSQGQPLSDLPQNMIPRNPMTSGSFLSLSANSLPGAGNGFIIDTAGLGMRVVRMRVGSTAGNFAVNIPYHFFLRDTVTQGLFYTKIHAYTGLNNSVNSQISFRKFNVVDSAGSGVGINLSSSNNQLPAEFSLSQNFPNPFNPETKIEFAIPVSGNVLLSIFDITGKQIYELVHENKTAGYYTASFNGSGLASGVYFYRLNVRGKEEFTEVKRMLLVK